MALNTKVPFTRKAGLAAGLTDHALRSSRFRQLLHGIYVDAGVKVDGYIEARAVLLASRADAMVSHHTAARLYGAVVPHDHRLHASVPPGVSRPDRQDLAVHSSSRVPYAFRGLRVTGPVATFLDLGRCLNLLDLVILGDSLVRKGRVTPEQLLEAAASATGRGARLVRRAAGLVRQGVDIFATPGRTIDRLERIFRQRGVHVGPRQDEWRRFFPGHD